VALGQQTQEVPAALLAVASGRLRTLVVRAVTVAVAPRMVGAVGAVPVASTAWVARVVIQQVVILDRAVVAPVVALLVGLRPRQR